MARQYATVTFADPYVVGGTLTQRVVCKDVDVVRRWHGDGLVFTTDRAQCYTINRAARLLVKRGKKPATCLTITVRKNVLFDYTVRNDRSHG
jgi:hypothetical protein